MHQWPALLGLIALGCIAGWLNSFLWPSAIKAKAEMYVAINPYRALSDANFLAIARPKYSNIDDYKNWQMSQLESAIFLEEILLPTLETLRLKDAYWGDITPIELSDMLTAEWRSAGTWTLIASHQEAQRAEEAVRAWTEIIMARIPKAIGAARNAITLEQQLQAMAYQYVEISLQIEHLETTLRMLTEWKNALESDPNSEPLDPLTYQQMVGAIAQVADFTPTWLELLREQPSSEATPDDIIAWLEQVIPSIEANLALQKSHTNWLGEERTRLARLFDAESRTSLGLSPNLEITLLRYYPPTQRRPSSTLMLLGGVIGGLVWIMLLLGQISLYRNDAELTQDS